MPGTANPTLVPFTVTSLSGTPARPCAGTSNVPVWTPPSWVKVTATGSGAPGSWIRPCHRPSIDPVASLPGPAEPAPIGIAGGTREYTNLRGDMPRPYARPAHRLDRAIPYPLLGRTPGTTVTGTPASRQAATSSPPRPNTNGSPPW